MNNESIAEAESVLRGVRVRELGLQPYAATRDAMLALTAGRDDASADEIWLLEHPPVYTLGQAGRIAHLLRGVDIPVVHTERGGQITYHGPGQLVAYLLIDLKRRGIKVREFVALIEAGVVETLAAYNLQGRTKPGAPGVYVESDGELQKIAALGLKIANGRSFHGLSLNVAMDLGPYASIDACGYPGLRSIDMASLGAQAAPAAVGVALARILERRIDAATR
jgi:lipoyl(octanoyl) transferase